MSHFDAQRCPGVCHQGVACESDDDEEHGQLNGPNQALHDTTFRYVEEQNKRFEKYKMKGFGLCAAFLMQLTRIKHPIACSRLLSQNIYALTNGTMMYAEMKSTNDARRCMCRTRHTSEEMHRILKEAMCLPMAR